MSGIESMCRFSNCGVPALVLLLWCFLCVGGAQLATTSGINNNYMKIYTNIGQADTGHCYWCILFTSVVALRSFRSCYAMRVVVSRAIILHIAGPDIARLSTQLHWLRGSSCCLCCSFRFSCRAAVDFLSNNFDKGRTGLLNFYRFRGCD